MTLQELGLRSGIIVFSDARSCKGRAFFVHSTFMDQFLDSPFVQEFIVGIILFLIAFGVQELIKRRRRQILSYEVLSNLALLNETQFADELKIIYGDKPLENPRVVAIRFENNTKATLPLETFSTEQGGKPISIELGSGYDILRPSFISDDIQPLELKLFNKRNNKQRNDSELHKNLKPKEKFDIQFLVSGKTAIPNLQVDGRSKSIELVTSEVNQRYKGILEFLLTLLFVLSGIFMIIEIVRVIQNGFGDWSFWSLFMKVSVSLVIFTAYISFYRFSR